jgi:dienelactone hydrolase
MIGLCSQPTGAFAQAPPLWNDLAPGAYDVGFRRHWELDETRVWPRSAALDSVAGTVSRPMRVDVWYPASCARAQRMQFERYVRMEAPDAAFEDLAFLTRRWDEYSYRGLAGDSARFDQMMATPTAACADAPPSPGRFPLVLYSGGWFNRAPDNTILAEYLASHGFVVASVPQLNPGLWTYDFRSDAASVENQVRDLEFALGILAASPMVDRRAIAAMGYSTGGDVALLLQGRNVLVRAVVGLDASWSLGSNNDVAGSNFFEGTHHRVPMLVARRPSQGLLGADAVLDSLTLAPRVVVEIPGSDHGSFSDDPAQRYLLDMDSAGHVATHGMVARAVLEFLRVALDRRAAFDGAALARLLGDRGMAAAFLPPASDSAGEVPQEKP